ncbi:ferredoxin-NADP reductase [Kutzneria buriramensis]|uniref:Ferredoxin-NADP reductase n=1 Tax=Kutzneria buriramensis TaxID=1045776 RepID=A0A3E0GZA1_9PSEU|nr:ferredoxin-NADP reductase [Kutzneria buriramensis]
MPALPLRPAWSGNPLLAAATWLTSPLTVDDYLGLIDPLLCARHPAGRVVAARPETGKATTLLIKPGRGWAGHKAGQYLPIGVRIDGALHWRTYSLTCPPEPTDGLLSITVQAVAGGRISPRLAQDTPPGTVLRLGPAQGDFSLPDPPPPRILMVTAGSGIAPVMGMLRTLAQRPPTGAHPDVLLIHSSRTIRECLFRDELQAMHRQLPWFRFVPHHTRPGGEPSRHVTPGRIADLCPDWRERETWACGPEAMLHAVEAHWADAQLTEQLHVERFRLAPFPPHESDTAGGRVRFLRTGVDTDAATTVPLLDIGEQAGVTMPYGCRRGLCFGCLTPLVHGRVRDLRTGEIHDEPGRLIQTCVSAAAGRLALDI